MAIHGRSSLFFTTVTTVVLLIVAGCNGFFVDPTLTAITVTPSTPSITVGATQQMVATGTFNDGSTSALTSVTWSSSDSTVASVSSGGLVTGVKAGTASITAASGTVSGSTSVNVTLANLTSICVSPTSASITSGQTQQFTATGGVGGGMCSTDITTSVSWHSSDLTVATIDSTGRATAATVTASKSTNITATSGIVTSSPVAVLTVNP
jgi:uncharacterized protein YjdB